MSGPTIALKRIFAAAAIASAASAADAAAMPAARLGGVSPFVVGIEAVATWDCGPYHCYWHPNYYGGWRSGYGPGRRRWGNRW